MPRRPHEIERSKAIIREVNEAALKQSGDFVLGKRPSLAAYEDVEELGLALAETQPTETQPTELRGVEHHFVRVRNALSKAFVSNRIFVGSTLLDELIFRAANDRRTRDLSAAVIKRVFAIGIHRAGAVIVPIHSFGIAGFGFLRHFLKASISVEFPQVGAVLSPQTNSLNETLSFLDSAAKVLRLGQRVPHDSIRHYERSRNAKWLVWNPLLVLRIRGASGSNYENQRFLITRIQIVTSLVFMIATLTADYSGGAKNWFGSSSTISNVETLDIKHYILLETSGTTRRELRCVCVPIHINVALLPSAKPLSLLQAALRTARGAQPPLRSPMRLLLGEPLRTL